MKKEILFKIAYVLAVVVVALALVYFALKETVPDLIPLLESGNIDNIQAYLRESGTVKGVLCTVLLQMVQVWSLFIAGMPIQIAAGCVFGFFAAFAICHLSAVLAQHIAFAVWRRLGQRLEKWMPVNVDKNDRLQAFLNSKAPPAYLVILACLVPFMPNGLIALFASRMDIGIGKYTRSVWIGSIINVMLCCAVGNRIVQGDWLIACLFFLILISQFWCMWFFRGRVLALYYKLTKHR